MADDFNQNPQAEDYSLDEQPQDSSPSFLAQDQINQIQDNNTNLDNSADFLTDTNQNKDQVNPDQLLNTPSFATMDQGQNLTDDLNTSENISQPADQFNQTNNTDALTGYNFPNNDQTQNENLALNSQESANIDQQVEEITTPSFATLNNDNQENQDNSQNLGSNETPPPFDNNNDYVNPENTQNFSNTPSAPPPPDFSNSDTAMPNEAEAAATTYNIKSDNGLLKKILFIVLILILVGGIAFLAIQFFGKKATNPSSSGTRETKNKTNQTATKVELNYWGLWEPNQVLQDVLTAYETQNGVKINYTQESYRDYRERLQSSIDKGTGPDIFRYHSTWIPMLKSYLGPDSKKQVDMSRFLQATKQDVVLSGQTYGVPLMYDSLALFYNPEMMEKAGQPVPQTWKEFKEAAQNLTVTQGKDIQIAGAAIGTTANVDHFSDILGLLLLQNNADPANPDKCFNVDTNESCPGQDALIFYTNFATVDKVWNSEMPNSIYAFANEKVAMIFAPSWRAFDIKDINPNLTFKTAPVPQITTTKQIAWSNYWVEGVSAKSKNQEEAWKFLTYLSSDEVLIKLYTSASNLRLFGEPYPSITLAKTIESEDVIGAFVRQAEYAQSWYMSSKTHDNGLNDQIIKYYEDAVNGMIDGEKVDKVMPTLTSGVKQVLTKYGISSSSSN